MTHDNTTLKDRFHSSMTRLWQIRRLETSFRPYIRISSQMDAGKATNQVRARPGQPGPPLTSIVLWRKDTGPRSRIPPPQETRRRRRIPSHSLQTWQWRWRDHDLRYRTFVPRTLQPGTSHGSRDGRLTTDVGRVALRNSPQNVNIIVLCMQSDFYAPLLRMNLQEIVNWKMILHSHKFKLSKICARKTRTDSQKHVSYNSILFISHQFQSMYIALNTNTMFVF